MAEIIGGLREGRSGDLLVEIRQEVHDTPDQHWLCRPDVLRGLRSVVAAGRSTCRRMPIAAYARAAERDTHDDTRTLRLALIEEIRRAVRFDASRGC